MLNIQLGQKIMIAACISILPSTSKTPVKNDEPYQCSATSNPYVEGFYAQKRDSMGALIIGDSSAYRSINPLRIWERTGIVSYNLSSATQTSWISRYLLEDALTYQTPDLVILDANVLFAKDGVMSRNCQVINAMPPSDGRIKASQYLLDNLASVDGEERTILCETYVKDTIKQAILRSDIHTQQITHGYIMNVNRKPFTNGDYMSENHQAISITKENKQNFKYMIQQLKERNIQVMMIRTPGAAEWSYGHYLVTKQFAEEQGVAYLDMNVLPYIDQIDWLQDSYDGGAHMNDHGAEKVTAMLSAYLQKHFRITRNEDLEVTEQFQKELQKYKEVRRRYYEEGILKNFS